MSVRGDLRRTNSPSRIKARENPFGRIRWRWFLAAVLLTTDTLLLMVIEANGTRAFHVIYEIPSRNVKFMRICIFMHKKMQD